MSFSMIARPTFRDILKPLNKRLDQIANVDDKAIREETTKMVNFALKGTIKEIKGRPMSWTTDD